MAKTKDSSSPPTKKSHSKKTVPTREEVALRAYHIYLERGGAPGNAFEDWTRAEKELLEQHSKKGRRKAAPKAIAA